MKKTILNGAIFITLLFQALVSSAHNNVVVIPLLGDEQSKLQNVITVAKSGGNFSDPVKAIDSISDAGQSNPYIIVIAPGIYDIDSPINLKPGVNILGSGKTATTIRSQGNTSPVFSYSNSLPPSKITVSGLRVEHLGPVHALGFSGSAEGLIIKDVAIAVSATSSSIGIFDSFNPISLTIDSVDIISRSSNAMGISLARSWNVDLKRSTIDTNGGNSSIGIRFWEARHLKITNSEVMAVGSRSMGVLEVDGVSALSTELLEISRSSVSGSVAGVRRLSDTGETRISQSTMSGRFFDTSNSGMEFCIASDNAEGALIPSNCISP